MTDLARLITELATAQAAYDAAREAKIVYFKDEHRGYIAQAEQNAKYTAAELARAKDALCIFVLKHRDELTKGTNE